jgi:arylsulfatase
MSPRPTLFLVLLAICAGAARAQAPEADGAPVRATPNIVLILADDLGYGDLGCYGQTKIRTPRLDRMAAEGMRFTSFYAASAVCAPSRCQLLTGLHGGHAFVRDNREVQPEGQVPLPESTPTLSGALRGLGYATGAFGKWGLGPPGSTGDPNRQGFDEFYGFNCQRQAHNFYPTHLWRNQTKEPQEGNTKGNLVGGAYSHDLIVNEALEFIRRGKDRPFFVFLPVTIPHVALQVPEDSLAEYRGVLEDAPYDGTQGYLPHPTPHAAYAAMVTRLDRDVGRVLDLLAELGLERDTLVLFTSDNGPTHGRVGGADSEFFRSAGELRGLKGSLHEGGVRVPLIARWPGVVSQGTVSDLPCIAYDLMPTVLELAGGECRGDGVSLVPTLTGRGTQAVREYLYWEFPGYGGQQAVRLGRFKAIRTGMHKGPVVTRLYDLDADPGEATDIAAEHPDVLARALAVIKEAHTDSREFPFPALDATPEPPPEYPGFTLVWADEFNTDGPPDPKNWTPEIGFVRNEEAQWYRPANAACRGGLLVIEARRERVPNPKYDMTATNWKFAREHAEYTSASVKTKGLHAWTYGRFEMRGRIDTRAGLWPAFWTVGAGSADRPARPWPACGEIDIMEYFRGTLLANAAWASGKPGVAAWDDSKAPLEDLAKQAGFTDAAAWSGAFHEWRMDWDEAAIRFFVDGRLLNEVDLTKTINGTPDAANPFREPHHIILNLAVGGTSGGNPDHTRFPARFEVDWVRVYQRVATPEG